MFSEFHGRQYLKPPAPNTIKFSNLHPNGFFKKSYMCHVYVIYMSCIYVNQNVCTQIVPSPLSDNVSKGTTLWARTCRSHVSQTPLLHMQCITLKDRRIYCILHNLTRRSYTHLSARDAQRMWMQSGIVSFWCRQVVTTLTPCVVTLPAEMCYLSNNTNIRLLPETNHAAIKTADSSTDITYYIPVR